MRKFIVFSLLSSFLFGVFISWQVISFMMTPAGNDPSEVVFMVNHGESFGEVARRLIQEGLVKDDADANRLKILAKILRFDSKMQVGEYSLHRLMNPLDILRVIVSGRSIQYALTFPEGKNMFEMADIFASYKMGTREEFLNICQDRLLIKEWLGEDLDSLEGYLFPETYNMTRASGAKVLIHSMVTNFLKNYEDVKREAAVTMPRHDTVTLASVIEKETGASFERPQISSVFHNRLDKGMRLQSDPTTLYGLLKTTGEMKENITKADLLSVNKYNTYTIAALPVGPIANPGREALKAALNPTKSNFLYFVSRNDGTHVFSESYEQHLAAVKDFQLNAKAREGKSWRDLKSPAEKEKN